MKEISSVVITKDGESKCGKTTIINGAADEARYQDQIYRNAYGLENVGGTVRDAETVDAMREMHERLGFRGIITISAGNAFRAAALYVALCEYKGQEKTSFTDDDTNKLRELLEIDGIQDVLQNDENIGRQVSRVAQFSGAQALCGALFADEVTEAYNRDGGGNLVIVDARDPIGHLLRNNKIGWEEGQVAPNTIMPFYIDTPADVAAERMSGNYEENLKIVLERRRLDATREELPVVRPAGMIDEFRVWQRAAAEAWASGKTPPVWRINNGREITLHDIQGLNSLTAALAHDVAMYSYSNNAIATHVARASAELVG